jgi:hypothetical protein
MKGVATGGPSSSGTSGGTGGTMSRGNAGSTSSLLVSGARSSSQMQPQQATSSMYALFFYRPLHLLCFSSWDRGSRPVSRNPQPSITNTSNMVAELSSENKRLEQQCQQLRVERAHLLEVRGYSAVSVLMYWLLDADTAFFLFSSS